eukprot:COSAG05_NODE_4264_length_1592_cov_1.528466_1_plen_381_part_10
MARPLEAVAKDALNSWRQHSGCTDLEQLSCEVWAANWSQQSGDDSIAALAVTLLPQAAQHEFACRALSGLSRVPRARLSVCAGGLGSERVLLALVDVLDKGDKHALFALQFLAKSAIDLPVGAQLFSPANATQALTWAVHIAATECVGDDIAQMAAADLLQTIIDRPELVDAVADLKVPSNELKALLQRLSSVGGTGGGARHAGAVGIVHALTTANITSAHLVAALLASNDCRDTLTSIVEQVRREVNIGINTGYEEAVGDAHRLVSLLLHAIRADSAAENNLVQVLIKVEGGVAMLAALSEGLLVATHGRLETAAQPDEQLSSANTRCNSQEGCRDAAEEENIERPADIIGRYEALLAQERVSTSDRVEALRAQTDAMLA